MIKQCRFMIQFLTKSQEGSSCLSSISITLNKLGRCFLILVPCLYLAIFRFRRVHTAIILGKNRIRKNSQYIKTRSLWALRVSFGPFRPDWLCLSHLSGAQAVWPTLIWWPPSQRSSQHHVGHIVILHVHHHVGHHVGHLVHLNVGNLRILFGLKKINRIWIWILFGLKIST